MPALIIIIDEFAELVDDAPDAMRDTDSIARLVSCNGLNFTLNAASSQVRAGMCC